MFCAKIRKILTALVVIIFLVVIVISKEKISLYFEFLEIFGFFLIIIGAIGRIWCSIYIAGHKNKVLTQDGPYSVCRNPLYLFSFIGAVGILLGFKQLFLLLLFIPLFIGYHHFVISKEEENLKDIFGNQFEEYKSKVSRIIPRFKNYWTRELITINPKKLISSLLEVMWFLWAIIFIELIEVIKHFF